MLVNDDFEGARDAFVRAMNASPGDQRLVLNFDVLIHGPEYIGKPKSLMLSVNTGETSKRGLRVTVNWTTKLNNE